MNTRVLVNGTPYEVDVLERKRDSVTFRLSEKTYRVEFESRLDHAASGRPAANGGAAQPGSPKKTAAVGAGDVVAPIPGVVVEVLVQPGQMVSAGDIVVRIEAMKMQNNIFAPVDGVIVAVSVQPGQEVRDGDPLVQIGKQP